MGNRIEIMVLEESRDLFERKLKVLVPFLSDQKDWRATGPHSRPLLPQSYPIKIF